MTTDNKCHNAMMIILLFIIIATFSSFIITAYANGNDNLNNNNNNNNNNIEYKCICNRILNENSGNNAFQAAVVVNNELEEYSCNCKMNEITLFFNIGGDSNSNNKLNCDCQNIGNNANQLSCSCHPNILVNPDNHNDDDEDDDGEDDDDDRIRSKKKKKAHGVKIRKDVAALTVIDAETVKSLRNSKSCADLISMCVATAASDERIGECLPMLGDEFTKNQIKGTKRFLITGTGSGATGFFMNGFKYLFDSQVCGERNTTIYHPNCIGTVAWTAKCHVNNNWHRHLLQNYLFTYIVQLVRDPLKMANSYHSFCHRTIDYFRIWDFIYHETPELFQNNLKWLLFRPVPCFTSSLIHWTTWHGRIEQFADARVLVENVNANDFVQLCNLITNSFSDFHKRNVIQASHFQNNFDHNKNNEIKCPMNGDSFILPSMKTRHHEDDQRKRTERFDWKDSSQTVDLVLLKVNLTEAYLDRVNNRKTWKPVRSAIPIGIAPEDLPNVFRNLTSFYVADARNRAEKYGYVYNK